MFVWDGKLIGLGTTDSQLLKQMESPFSHDNRMSKDFHLSLISYNDLNELVYLHKSFTLEFVQVVGSAV